MSNYWISKLNESDSRLHKEDVLRQALEIALLGDHSSQVFLSLVNAAYNPMITWGVKQVSTTDNLVDRENPWDDFNDLLKKLRLRELTGNAAKDALNQISQRFDSVEWNNFCINVIKKDLRAGISDKTINKVCKKTIYEVPVFGCQLATNCEDRPEMSGVKRLEPKLDGVRVLALCSYDGINSSVVCYSRNGKIFENFGHIESQISDNMKKLSTVFGFSNFVLDGEVVGETFQQLMQQARRKSDVNAVDSVFHVFDIIPTVDFVRKHWNCPLGKRLDILDKMRPFLSKMPHVKLLTHIVVDLDTSDGKDQFERYCQYMVNDGFEGVMVKDMKAPYECKRNTFWMKYKPIITVDLEVIAIEEGTGKNAGRMGAFVCEGTDDGKFIKVNVGSGFTDDQREDYWTNQDIVVGRLVEVMADSITQNQNMTYSLRFPRFSRFRDALTGDKE